MNIIFKSVIAAACLAVGLIAAPIPVVVAAPVQSVKAQPEPDSNQILQKMCDFLKSQKQFTYKAEVVDEQVNKNGNKLQYAIDIETSVRRPDRLRVNAEGDVVYKQFFFDGKVITLYDKDRNVYGILESPPDIESALDKANRDFGVRVALTDLASPQLHELLNKRIKNTLYVGLHKVRGVPCHHLFLDGGDVQAQVWIEAGNRPVPLKVVLSHNNMPGSPQWSAYLSDWNFSPQLPDNLFVFTPPNGAEKIRFVPVKKNQAPKPGMDNNKDGGKS